MTPEPNTTRYVRNYVFTYSFHFALILICKYSACFQLSLFKLFHADTTDVLIYIILTPALIFGIFDFIYLFFFKLFTLFYSQLSGFMHIVSPLSFTALYTSFLALYISSYLLYTLSSLPRYTCTSILESYTFWHHTPCLVIIHLALPSGTIHLAQPSADYIPGPVS